MILTVETFYYLVIISCAGNMQNSIEFTFVMQIMRLNVHH